MGKSRILIIVVLLIAAFFRLYQLPDLPPGLNFDEAGNGVAAVEILNGSPRIWWRIGGGKEPLWPYLIALSTMILGYTSLALRLPAALAGLLTVAAVYPLMLKLFHGHQARLVSLLTVLGLGLSEWHLHFSRLGLRAILLPLLSTLALFFLWRGLRKIAWASRNGFRFSGFSSWASNSLLSALFIALAIYAYIAARLLPMVLLLFFTLYWLASRMGDPEETAHVDGKTRPVREGLFPAPFRTLGKSSFITTYFLLIFGLIICFCAPLIVYFSFNPADFVARSTTVSIFNPDWNKGDLLGAAWRTLSLTFGTFIALQGDANPLTNLPHHPALPFMVAPFFLLGLATSLHKIIHVISRSQSRFISSTRPTSMFSHLFLLCWWIVMLLAAILAPEGAPHHLRLIGTIVPSYAFVALGFVTATNIFIKIVGQLPSSKLQARGVAYLLPAACYGLLAVQTYTNYFLRWPHTIDFTLPFDLYATRLAADIARAPAEVAYVLPMDIRAAEEARHYTLDYLLTPHQSVSYSYIPVDEDQSERLLTQIASGKDELRIVRWTDDKHREADAKEIVTYLLETTAHFRDRQSFPVYEVEMYTVPRLDSSGCDQDSLNKRSEDCHTSATRFMLPLTNSSINTTLDNLLRIDSAFVQATVEASGGWLPVAITLAPLTPMEVDYKASVRLIDTSGERIAQKDRVLLHNFHQGTSLWPPETVNEYYLLPLPPDIIPGDYRVVVVIYHPETLSPLTADGVVEIPLGTIRVE